MTAQTDLRQYSIQCLVELLSKAIWQRNREDPTFQLFDHMMHALDYKPLTAAERRYWDELTGPHRHAELKSFVEVRRAMPANRYALAMDHLLLTDSSRRLGETFASPPDQKSPVLPGGA
jgi:hypothetical protein